jgi:hypothetical protein
MIDLESSATLAALDFAVLCDYDGAEHSADAFVTYSCGHGAFYCTAHVADLRDYLASAAALASVGIDIAECVVCEAPAPAIVRIDPIAAT